MLMKITCLHFQFLFYIFSFTQHFLKVLHLHLWSFELPELWYKLPNFLSQYLCQFLSSQFCELLRTYALQSKWPLTFYLVTSDLWPCDPWNIPDNCHSHNTYFSQVWSWSLKQFFSYCKKTTYIHVHDLWPLTVWPQSRIKLLPLESHNIYLSQVWSWSLKLFLSYSMNKLFSFKHNQDLWPLTFDLWTFKSAPLLELGTIRILIRYSIPTF